MGNWLADTIIGGIDLFAYPPTVQGGAWHYKLGTERVIVNSTDMLAVLRSSGISSQRMAGDVLRYYHTTIEQRKLSRKQRRAAREAKK